ncbi:MAG: OmpA family protein [Proteobacteria bacterium]|nr:OmpA family protein [Pseudomonadota bacterium]
MKHRFSTCLLAVFAMCAAGTQAYADGFDVRQFYPIAGPHGTFSVESSKILGHLDYSLQLTTDYANTPLRFQCAGTDNPLASSDCKLEHLATMNLSASLGLLDILEVALVLPFIPYEGYNQTYRDQSPQIVPRAQSGVFGDMQIRAKATILKREDYSGFGLGAGVLMTLPTGKEAALIGDGSFTGRPYIAADYEIGPVELILNAGFTFRKKSQFLDYTLSHGFNYGFGVVYHAIPEWLAVKGEIFGETPLSKKATQDYHQSAEFLIGATIMTPIGLDLTVGGGAGLGNGVRNPLARFLLGISYQPRSKDSDGDGIDDRNDACPTTPGLAEFYGCPNPDTDGDGWCDPWVESDALAEKLGCKRTDLCPDIPGLDEFQGCPNPDTDNDGWCDPWVESDELAQIFGCKRTDLCPELPGLDEFYGCPDPDIDGDGICDPFVDALGLYEHFFCSGIDLCPDEPEDFDGFEDEDGCPDPDNDGDGLCDPWVSETGQSEKYAHICTGIDLCPDEPGPRENDGCPQDPQLETAQQFVIVLENKLEIKDTIYFDTNKSTIKKQSHTLLDHLAHTLQNTRSIRHLSVEGHTDDTGNHAKNVTLSLQRAQAVVDYLIQKGVDPSRLSAKGFGPDRPLDPAKTKQARALNRRVEFIITDRSQN